MHYYVSVGAVRKGPYTRQQLSRMWDSGAITCDALYSAEGMSEWQPVEKLMGSQAASDARWGEPPPSSRKAEGAGGKMATRMIPLAAKAWMAVKSFLGPWLGGKDTLPLAQRLVLIAGLAVVIIGGAVLVRSVGHDNPVPVASAPVEGEPAAAFERTAARFAPPPRNTYPEETRQRLIAEDQEWLTENRQGLFDAFHPTGTAARVKVNDVTIRWKNGTPGHEWNDVESYAVKSVLYWSGPITTDGYSEIEFVYDNAIERVTSWRVVRSNGITRDDVTNAAGELAVEFLKEMARAR